ncbi:hypothetical protein [Shimia sp.]|uniref:hypothetical protein n=1 Tax=Shimia sp. TaxID=1954381 RepID=UPI00356884B4
MIFRTSMMAICAGGVAMAGPPLKCSGTDPDWTLTLGASEARFDYLRRTRFQVPQSSRAEGRDWPRAYTLIADFDSAILLVDRAPCDGGPTAAPYAAHVLTQRGQTPILLTGCCRTQQ